MPDLKRKERKMGAADQRSTWKKPKRKPRRKKKKLNRSQTNVMRRKDNEK